MSILFKNTTSAGTPTCRAKRICSLFEGTKDHKYKYMAKQI